jgi:hypothetical protein
MSVQTKEQTSAQTDTSEGEKKPDGGKKLSAKGPGQSLAKKLDILLEDRDSTKLGKKDVVATKTRKLPWRKRTQIDEENEAVDKRNGSGGGRKGNNLPKAPPKPIQNRLITSLNIYFSNIDIWRDFYGYFGVMVMLLLGNTSV